MIGRLSKLRAWRLSVPVTAIVVLGLVAAALAYFTATGIGTGAATAGTLSAPTITSATPGAGTVALVWSTVTPPGGSGTVSYSVSRNGGTPGGDCPTSASPTTVTSCTDSGLSAGTYQYAVTAHWRSWTATSTTVSAPVASGAATHLVLSAATTTPTAGAADNLTITAKDAGGITVPSYTGDHNLSFSGANTAPDGTHQPTVTAKTGSAVAFGTATTITFVNGVAGVLGSSNGVMTLYKTETATVVVSDGSLSNGSGLSVTVSAGSAVKVAILSSALSGTASASATLGPISMQQQDSYGNGANAGSGGVAVTLSSSSAGGVFAASSGGATSSTLAVTIPNGSSTTPANSAYYGDSVAGGPVITAAHSGLTSATQTETITRYLTVTQPADASFINTQKPTFSGTTTNNTASSIVLKIFACSGSGCTYGTHGQITLPAATQTSTAQSPSAGTWTWTTGTNLTNGTTYTTQAQQTVSGTTYYSNANSFTVDTSAPTVGTTTITKSDDWPNSTTGHIRPGPGGTFYVYANATDTGSGIASVTANISNVSTVSPVTMSACTSNCTINGTTYGYVSTLQTALSSLTAGNKTYTITATNNAGTATTSANQTVLADTAAPLISSIATKNNGGGAGAGKPEPGDTIAFGYGSAIDGISIVTSWNWNWLTSTNVEVKITAGSTSDTVQILSADGTTTLAFGTLDLGAAGYVTGGAGKVIVFGGAGATTASTLLAAGNYLTYTVTLGALNTSLSTGAQGTHHTNSNATWTPTSPGNPTYDQAGNTLDTTTKPNVTSGNHVQF